MAIKISASYFADMDKLDLNTALSSQDNTDEVDELTLSDFKIFQKAKIIKRASYFKQIKPKINGTEQSPLVYPRKLKTT